jgi:HEAT repeat protein
VALSYAFAPRAPRGGRSSHPVLAALMVVLVPAIGVAGSRVTFDGLLADLKSPNAKTRQAAADALGKTHKREAVSGLSAVVRDPEPKVRFEVVRALRELRDRSAVSALVTATEDTEANVRAEAVGAIVHLYADFERPSGVQKLLGMSSDDVEHSTLSPGISVDSAAIRALTGSLRDEDKGIREQAALALGVLGARGSLGALAAALADPEPTVRAASAASIGKLGGTEQARALIPLLADDSAATRNQAVRALGALHLKESAPALREMFESNRKKDFGVKVLEALSRTADPAQADLYRELLTDADPSRKRCAIEGLARISDAGLLPAYKKDFQREKNEDLKLAYSFGIVMLGDRSFLDSLVLSLPLKAYGERCREYLLELGRPMLPDLYEYLKDPSDDVRAELCNLLGTLGDAETIARITPLVKDPSERVADSANRAIERLKQTAAAPSEAP